jgi:hypothetical protein
MNAARNRTAEGAALLADIDAWCARTGAPQGKLGSILFRHAGFVALLRKRLTVTAETEEAVRQFIAEHPDGVGGIPIPSPFLKPRVGAMQAQRRLLAAVNDATPPCRLCGRTPDTACRYPSCPLRVAA